MARGVTNAVFDFGFARKTVDINGKSFTFKELSVGESDACTDASKEPDGTINGRIYMRMLIAKSSVEPKITVDDLAELPNRIYLKIAEAVNEVNSEDDALEPPSEEEPEAKNS